MNTNLKDTAQDIQSKASGKFQDLQQKAAGKFQDVQKRVTAKAKDMSDATDTYVHENPWQTVAIVALAACIFGYMIGSMRDSD